MAAAPTPHNGAALPTNEKKQDGKPDMKTPHAIICATSVLCVLAFIAAPATAVFQNGAQPGGRMGSSPDFAARLDALGELGFDVSAIQAALESGDRETARTLMRQFAEEHKDELPIPHSGGRHGGTIDGLLDRLEEQGYDLTAIRTAVENGDDETARTLMRQFMEEHKDELPTPPQRAEKAPCSSN
ncbi:MAG: hypothetical protein GKC04_07345 [Methanomicrobiales archaeon]|nr:hypothetical protein [Methanomicrobiales archaeon]